YRKWLSWKGKGALSPVEETKLKSLVLLTHAEGKLLRLWASPDKPEVWAKLLELGVDFVNTDDLKGFSTFMWEK
ncbi:MAG: histidinol-phosphatase, partial [Bacteroidota bacterium]